MILCGFQVPDNRSSRAEFIRVPPEASVVQVKELLQRFWCKGVSDIFVDGRETFSPFT